MPKETEKQKQERLHFEKAVGLTINLMDHLIRESALDVLGLKEREKDIVQMKWKYHLTFEQIADNLSLSVDRVKQLHHLALMHIYLRIPKMLKECPAQKQLHEENKQLKEENQRYKKLLDSLSPEEKEEVRKNDIRHKNIYDFDFSVRTFNALRSARIKTVDDLLQTDAASLFAIRGFGMKTMVEVEAFLNDHQLSLRKP
jgi:hypothetical protein